MVSADVETDAVPPTSETPDPPGIATPLSLNVTVPDGVPPAGLLVTVDVRVTWLLNSDGLADDVTTVVVGWFVTVWTMEFDVDCAYEPSPP